MATYTRSDVASRNGANGAPLWIIIRDSVYDVTNFVKEHPGDMDTIMEQAGKDGTKDFDDIGHSSDARLILSKYKIGDLIEEEKRYDANGKRRKRVVSAIPEKKINNDNNKSFLGIVTCGLIG